MSIFPFGSLICLLIRMQAQVKKEKQMWGQSPLYYILKWHLWHQVHNAHGTPLNKNCKTYWQNWKRRHNLSPWSVNAFILYRHSKCFAQHFMGGAHHKNFMPVLCILDFVMILASYVLVNIILILAFPKHFTFIVTSTCSSYSWFN